MGLVVTDKTVIDLIKRYRSPIASGGTPGAVCGISILDSAPAAVTGQCLLWINSAHYAAGTMIDHGIQCVFPDGTNRNLVIPFGFAGEDGEGEGEGFFEG